MKINAQQYLNIYRRREKKRKQKQETLRDEIIGDKDQIERFAIEYLNVMKYYN